jgi:hypothetical protein
METEPRKFFVEVVDSATQKVIRKMGPHPRKRAERIEYEVIRKLQHEAYHTRIVEAK